VAIVKKIYSGLRYHKLKYFKNIASEVSILFYIISFYFTLASRINKFDRVHKMRCTKREESEASV